MTELRFENEIFACQTSMKEKIEGVTKIGMLPRNKEREKLKAEEILYNLLKSIYLKKKSGSINKLEGEF